MSVYIACECGFYDRERHHGAVGGGKCQHHQMRALTAENARLREAGQALYLIVLGDMKAGPGAADAARQMWRAALGGSDEG